MIRKWIIHQLASLYIDFILEADKQWHNVNKLAKEEWRESFK